ncbi:AAA family ATPase [Dyadobacter sp. CY345]|uniref:AAA family ATPase n=1 Tax=Dyadobacter sp. CY345 TaxID=2909335 RepID=UPI001F4029BE|nr:AAA family ATPase [Dyadobacter sp. CY345]MCF2442457.1 AAA family ATPase [Dyadobacter sp. CY345]
MADKLIIRDFGPIKNAELDIKKTTVLIGPQGSGKSTLAKLVAIFNSLQNGEEDLIALLSRYSLSRKYITGGTILEKSKEVDSFTRKIIFESLKLNFDFNTSQIGVKARDFEDFKNFYIPAERTFLPLFIDSIFELITQETSIPKFISEFARVYFIAKSKITTLPVEYLDVSYKNENGNDYIFSSESGDVLLSESASGYQSIFPMKLVIENNINNVGNFFIIEEPELNLYPSTQKSLIYDLTDKCTRKGGHLLMTTHSPYVLSSLNTLLFAYKVAQKHPERAEEIAKVIPKESWLNPDDFIAYFVAEGTIRSITSSTTGLIAENELDGVSEDIMDEFNALMEIYRTENATSH